MDTTQNGVPSGRKHKIAVSLALLVVALVLVGVAVVRGPKTSPDPMGVRTDKKVLQETRYLAGTVVSVTSNGSEGGEIVLQALIKDMNTGSERYIEPEEVRMVEKTYTVKLSKDTVFSGKAVGEIVGGDHIAVTTKESIYKDDELTALSVSFYDPKEEVVARILGKRNVVAGTTKEVRVENGEHIVTITAQIPDEDALRALDLSGAYAVPRVERTYDIRILPETKLPVGVEVMEIRSGSRVRVLANEDIYDAPGVLSAVSLEIN